MEQISYIERIKRLKSEKKITNERPFRADRDSSRHAFQNSCRYERFTEAGKHDFHLSGAWLQSRLSCDRCAGKPQ